MSTHVSRSRGMTLVELLVVLVILGVMAGFVGISWHPDQWERPKPKPGSALAIISDASRQAVRLGKPIAASIQTDTDSVSILALPDGRVLGAQRFGLDALSGQRAQ